MKFREGGTNGSAAAGAARQPHLADVRRLAARKNAISRADEAASGVASSQQIDCESTHLSTGGVFRRSLLLPPCPATLLQAAGVAAAAGRGAQPWTSNHAPSAALASANGIDTA
ncbi:hypothetical protein L0Z31_09900 (plasmid) [Burkholderia vietnamiensis]|uniref:hypothetical protein n=1 Tax=Burkholderia vietnamiensis TaxID=60552 RepID=UPI0020199EC1|nr:hypothetical protein [Burkholderia vietnamiensis]MCO1347795.1 hypothetical protein [Burkholderia vietnamiensis]MCO1430269.1 hypothetical protein [Burkholderia vietnamiensis]UQN46680.1 hypothetical protein L0Y95_15025 [Burkholderia vietnamiensis]